MLQSFIFQLGLIVSTLSITVGLDVLDSGFVGINTSTPEVPLHINGSSFFSDVIATEINAGYLSQVNNTFVVDADGFIGFGITSEPDYEVATVFYKVFSSNDYHDVYQEFRISQNTVVSENITLLDIGLNSESDNYFGDFNDVNSYQALGLDIDMTDLQVKTEK